MKALTRSILLLLLVGFFVRCSPVKFSLDEGKCEQVGGSCVVENGKYVIGPETVTVGGGSGHSYR